MKTPGVGRFHALCRTILHDPTAISDSPPPQRERSPPAQKTTRSVLQPRSKGPKLSRSSTLPRADNEWTRPRTTGAADNRFGTNCPGNRTLASTQRGAHSAIVPCRSGTPKVRRKFAKSSPQKAPSGELHHEGAVCTPARLDGVRSYQNPSHAVWTRRGRTLAILAYAGRVWAAAAAWGDFALLFTKSKPAALRKEIGGHVASCPSRGSRHSRWAQAVEIWTPAAHAGEERGAPAGRGPRPSPPTRGAAARPAPAW